MIKGVTTAQQQQQSQSVYSLTETSGLSLRFQQSQNVSLTNGSYGKKIHEKKEKREKRDRLCVSPIDHSKP
jgi:hypothetical protein